MFSTSAQAVKYAEHFMAQERAREIASTGRSNIKTTSQKKKNKMIHKDSMSTTPTASFSSDVDTSNRSVSSDSSEVSNPSSSQFTKYTNQTRAPALRMVGDVIDDQIETLERLCGAIDKHAGMARARLANQRPDAPAENVHKLGACLSMKQVKVMQQEYVHVLKILAGLREVKRNIQNGMADPSRKNTEKLITQVRSVRFHPVKKTHTNGLLLHELEFGLLYPEIDGRLVTKPPMLSAADTITLGTTTSKSWV